MTDETERASLCTRPKSGIAPPETGMHTPRMVIAPPETGMNTPRMVIALPETVIAPPEMGMHTPRMVIAPPETVIRPPGTHPLHPATQRHTYIYLIHLSLRHPRTIRHTASQSLN